MTRTLFIQFSIGKWREDELDDMMEIIADEMPDDVKLAAMPKDLDLLSKEEVNELVEALQ